ncbi:MAG: DUF4917 family protein [Solirubrobacteraceae bacterium]
MALRPQPIDGSLAAWGALEREASWGALLIGNGLSINVSERFAYRSLYQTATSRGMLSRRDQALFETLGTENFEVVLGMLDTAIRVSHASECEVAPLAARYCSVQSGLGATVRAAHLPHAQTPPAALATIKRTMLRHEAVFTTSYDLLAYWAMGYDQDYGRLADLFWSPSPHGGCAFDGTRARVWPGWTPLFYLHGALHLVTHADGVTRKLRRTSADAILDQFERPCPDDPLARPLLVSEGTAGEKLREIERNAYLRHAIDALRGCQSPLVVFGSALSDQDQHLIDAINEHPERAVAVSMVRSGGRRERLALQARIRVRLQSKQLSFFDAATHPLGGPALRGQQVLGRQVRAVEPHFRSLSGVARA